ncbi:hypothetical protein JMM81_20140 [Bacillus sp. V3B]|uniref:hypothetical protein n=1 Tax=Bacillus sp. V3B TaxID=2804915 RepID=UPI00210E3B9D|nr:hypothetical protein [Bacillus sp. V3B]MCQ6277188.1 hypothetical protein [Bacillus sp. V3B]
MIKIRAQIRRSEFDVGILDIYEVSNPKISSLAGCGNGELPEEVEQIDERGYNWRRCVN